MKVETLWTIKLRCEACGRGETREVMNPPTAGEKLIFRHVCSDTSSSGWTLQ